MGTAISNAGKFSWVGLERGVANMDVRRNPFMYSTKTDKTITDHEFDKVLLKLESKRIKNEHERIRQKTNNA